MRFLALKPLCAGLALVILVTVSLGAYSNTLLVDGPPKVLWTLSGQGWAGASAALGTNGAVFLADARGIATRVDPISGKPTWRFDLADRLLYTPALSGGMLFLARVGELAAVGLDGQTRWLKKIDDSPVLSPAIGRDGTVYAAGGPSLFALHPDGAVIWEHRTGTFYSASPVIAADGTIYVGAKDVLLALDSHGRLKWKYQAISTLYANPSIDAVGNLYLGTATGLISLDPAGRVRWRSPGAPVEATPVIGSDGRVFAGDLGGQLRALSSLGQLLWVLDLGASIAGSAALTSELMYIGSSDGRLHAVDLGGHERWSLQLNGAIMGSPVIGSDGHVYVGAGKSYSALATTLPLAVTPWPLARQNPAGQGRAP